jgi:hypothetical protein
MDLWIVAGRGEEGGHAVTPAHYPNIVTEFLDISTALDWERMDGSNDSHALRTCHPWIFICGVCEANHLQCSY